MPRTTIMNGYVNSQKVIEKNAYVLNTKKTQCSSTDIMDMMYKERQLLTYKLVIFCVDASVDNFSP